MATDQRDLLYRLAYDEALRALAAQEVLIESLRSRAGLLLSADAVTTSFLGSEALRGDRTTVVAWIALVVFAAAAGSCLSVLWPRRWELVIESGHVLRTFAADEEVRMGEAWEQMSLHLGRSSVRNRKGLSHLSTLLQLSATLLSLDVALWVIAAAAT